MTQGYRSVVAIGEAQHKAIAWGFDLITLGTVKKIPFNFVIEDHSRIILVRVRRLKYGQDPGPEEITRTCAQELAEVRDLSLPSGISCELSGCGNRAETVFSCTIHSVGMTNYPAQREISCMGRPSYQAPV